MATKQVTALALYTFNGEQPGDLAFYVNDVITVTKQEGSWWEGMAHGVTGVFPSNYVQLQ